MKLIKQKQLSFEPLYHRRLNQSSYIPLLNHARKSLHILNSSHLERERILMQGFTVTQACVKAAVKDLIDPSKGTSSIIMGNINAIVKLPIS